jgi:16S rRNA (guanine527-N7)-methyltransferase
VTEDEAKAWLNETLGVSRETLGRLDAFREMVIAENACQNLISAGSIPYFWSRHIVDSAQLFMFSDDSRGDAETRSRKNEAEPPSAPPRLRVNQNWLDLGTGAGFPGMVVAILAETPITFVESRRRRVEFLRDSAKMLGLDHVTAELCQLESFNGGQFDVISARAFAPLTRLFPLAHRFSTEKTLWLLPKGRSAHAELESIGESWHGVFHVKQSVTDPDSHIVVGTKVAPKRQK